MNAPFGWAAPALAIGAAGVALATTTDLAVAVPAAAVAAAAGALAVADTVARGLGRAASRPAAPFHRPGVVREAFESGRYGRETLVAMLDRAERTGPNPGLPTRSLEEIRRLTALPLPEFRRYLAARLTALEAAE